MLTEEQIQNLKKGDPIVIRTLFDHADGDGDIRFRTPSKIGGSNIAYIHPSCVSLPSEHGTSVPTPKYDPTRPFKKGDKVRIVKYNGRKFDAAPPTFQLGKVYRVDEDEDTEHCYVMLQSCDLYYAHPVAFLELVTPVEELKPYNVVDAHTHWDVADKDMKTVATYNKVFHPHAKVAAEAERDRLNAEWRKEHEND